MLSLPGDMMLVTSSNHALLTGTTSGSISLYLELEAVQAPAHMAAKMVKFTSDALIA